VLVGAPHFDRDLYNACYVLSGGEVKAVYRKRFLPNYGVFDEDRYFAPGRDLILLEHGKTLVGLTVCEDMWQPGPPATDLALAGAELLVNISASPFYVGRDREREEMFVTRARDNSCFVAFCNAVGGQDELIFDGHSVVIDDEGTILCARAGVRGGAARRRRRAEGGDRRRLRDVLPPRARARARAAPAGRGHSCRDARSLTNARRVTGSVVPFVDDLEQMRLALELGLHDYVDKNGFPRRRRRRSPAASTPPSTAALAAEALGADASTASRCRRATRRKATRTDARRLAESLGCSFREIPIGEIVDTVARRWGRRSEARSAI
jgi:NAD+ synthase (glutamine-hydrolysing)